MSNSTGTNNPGGGAGEGVSSGPPRKDMIESAVSFLTDGRSSDSPLSRKVQFLESKGMNQKEIDEAIRLSSSPVPRPQQQQQSYYPSNNYGYGPRSEPPPYGPGGMGNEFNSRPDWRDMFIMTVVGGGIGYVLVGLARRYLLPHLRPPSQSLLQSSQQSLEAKYDEAAEILSQLQAQSTSLENSLEDQKKRVEEEMEGVRKVLDEVKEREEGREREVREMREMVEGIKDGLEDMFQKSKDSQMRELDQVVGELKSLRSLLENRSASSIPSAAGASSIHSSRYVPQIPSSPVPPAPSSSSSFTAQQQQSITGTGTASVSGSGSGGNDTPNGYEIPSVSSPPPQSSTAVGSSRTSTNPFPLPKPGLPAWQLKSANSSSSSLNKEKEKEKEAGTPPLTASREEKNE